MDFTNINSPNNNIIEEHNYCIRDGKHLFYSQYLPKGNIKSGMVFCSPLAEEKVRTVRVMVSFARVLASMGIAAIMFDYYGDGDSEGNFEDATFDDRLEDIKYVYKFFRDKCSLEKVGILGLRWGATLAGHLADSLSPDILILWEPIIDTEKHLYDFLRLNIAAQMLVSGKVLKNRDELAKDLEVGGTVGIEGYAITSEFYKSAKQLKMTDKKYAFANNALIVQISKNPDKKIGPDYEKLQSCLSASQLIQVPKEFEWEKTELWQPAPPLLFNETINFIKANEF
jgi:exosortase A-associated hydrolase 2